MVVTYLAHMSIFFFCKGTCCWDRTGHKSERVSSWCYANTLHLKLYGGLLKETAMCLWSNNVNLFFWTFVYAFHREEPMRRQLSSIGFNFSYLKNKTIMKETYIDDDSFLNKGMSTLLI